MSRDSVVSIATAIKLADIDNFFCKLFSRKLHNEACTLLQV